MGEKGLLHWTKVPEFTKFMLKKGYVQMKNKGPYEHKRFHHPNRIGLQKTVILFDRDRQTEHVTVQDKDYSLLREFINDVTT